jgi:hypothetical protein
MNIILAANMSRVAGYTGRKSTIYRLFKYCIVLDNKHYYTIQYLNSRFVTCILATRGIFAAKIIFIRYVITIKDKTF